MKYFKNVESLQELRKQYKELPMDNGGNVAQMQEINVEYDKLFKLLKNKHDSTATNNDKTSYDNMKYDFTEDALLREMLNKIIGFSGITIEVCGSWIWAFDSFKYRKELKEMGFKYASKKKAWYWHSESFRKKSHKVLSMDDIRNYYGSTEVQTGHRVLLQQA